MVKYFILISLLILSTEHVFGQQYDTTKSLNYSDKVKRVHEVDSLNASVVIHEFNQKGYLIFTSSKAGDYMMKENIKYKDSLILQKEKIFRDIKSFSKSSENYSYDMNSLIAIEFVDKGKDEEGLNYTNTISRRFEYDDRGRVFKSYSSFNTGKKESVDLYYGQEDGLVKIKNISDGILKRVEKEYRKDNVIIIKIYDDEIEPISVEISRYNEKNKLTEFTQYSKKEKTRNQIYTYQDGILIYSKVVTNLYGLREFYYNKNGDLEEDIYGAKNFEYRYVYNEYGDQTETKCYYDGKLINVIRTKYEYWQ